MVPFGPCPPWHLLRQLPVTLCPTGQSLRSEHHHRSTFATSSLPIASPSIHWSLLTHFSCGTCSSRSPLLYAPLARACPWYITIGPPLPSRTCHWHILNPVVPFGLFPYANHSGDPYCPAPHWPVPAAVASPLVHLCYQQPPHWLILDLLISLSLLPLVASAPRAPHSTMPNLPVPLPGSLPLVRLCHQGPPHWLILDPVVPSGPFHLCHLLQGLPITLRPTLASPCSQGIPIVPSLTPCPPHWLIFNPVAAVSHFLHGIHSRGSPFPYAPSASSCPQGSQLVHLCL